MFKQNNYAGNRIWWLNRVSQIPLLTLAIVLAGCETNKFIGAAAKGNAPKVEAMLVEGADIDQRGAFDRTALMAAAWEGRLETVQVLIEHGANLDARDSTGWTALMYAARDGHYDVIRTLVDRGADVNVKETKYGQTSLMLAANNRRVKAVEVLVELGADVNMRDKVGGTALMWAVEPKAGVEPSSGQRAPGVEDVFVLDNRPVEIVNILLSHGADPNARENSIKIVTNKWLGTGMAGYGRTALHVAAGNFGMEPAVKALINYGADVNAKSEGGRTPLMYAAFRSTRQHIQIVKDLLAHGANVDAKDNKGRTALAEAKNGDRYAGHDEIERLLKEASAAKDK